MPGAGHFKTVYNYELIKITGINPTYTIEWPDGKTMTIERFADGWYMPKSLEQYWTDHDIPALGGDCRPKNKTSVKKIPLNEQDHSQLVWSRQK